MRSRLALAALITATLVFTSTTLARPADQVQVIDVTAKKYEFSPSPIRVKQGARVQLKVTATDHVHGLWVEDYPDGSDHKGSPGLVFSVKGCLRVEKGQTQTLEFVAQTPGTYQMRCCVHCGWNHRSMKGELIVEP